MSEEETPVKLSEVEYIKQRSNFLRGTIKEGLANPLTGAIAYDDTQLIKFHGSYQQDDRDVRLERQKQKLEPAYSFMLRVRLPGGICTPQQWLTMDNLGNNYGNQTLRLTTRQTFQLHGILKRNFKSVIQDMDKSLMDSIAACGDVNRNVMCNPNPVESSIHQEVYDWSIKISEHLLPHTSAYSEIWLDGKRVAGGESVSNKDSSSSKDQEPLYGETYLPRKFKTGMAIPPYNDVDVYSQDMGFIAIVEDKKLLGFNVLVGGGMGTTHGDPETYPRVADVIGFVTPEQVLQVSENIVAIQRDYGSRTNRKRARFKYTIDDKGIDWFKAELNQRLGWELAPTKPFEFVNNADRYGWVEGFDKRWHLTLFISNGRVADVGERQLMTGLREIAKVHQGDFRITPNQNLIIANISQQDKEKIEGLAKQYGLIGDKILKPLTLNSMACVAFPTCGLAMAESERYIPTLLEKLEDLLGKYGLDDVPITIRMTGCPNGCARPFLAEIGLVGKGPGKYNLFLGASHNGDRLNKLYLENINEEKILESLEPIFKDFSESRASETGYAKETFGDFVVRKEYV